MGGIIPGIGNGGKLPNMGNGGKLGCIGGAGGFGVPDMLLPILLSVSYTHLDVYKRQR